MPLNLEICGYETISVDNSQNFTYDFDYTHTNYTLEPSDYTSIFASLAVNCPIIKYMLAATSDGIIDTRLYESNVKIDSTGIISFDFEKLYSNPEK